MDGFRAAGVWGFGMPDELARAIAELNGARYSHYLNHVTELSTFDLDTAVVRAIATGDNPASVIALYLRDASRQCSTS